MTPLEKEMLDALKKTNAILGKSVSKKNYEVYERNMFVIHKAENQSTPLPTDNIDLDELENFLVRKGEAFPCPGNNFNDLVVNKDRLFALNKAARAYLQTTKATPLPEGVMTADALLRKIADDCQCWGQWDTEFNEDGEKTFDGRRRAIEIIEDRDVQLLAKQGAVITDDINLNFIKEFVNKQAEDEGLWFIARTAPESYLQQELRKLHELVESYCERKKEVTDDAIARAELLPCPFCGGDATVIEDPCNYSVECNDCGPSTFRFKEKNAAIRAWNLRHSPSMEATYPNHKGGA